jgi:putative flippase GtrA
MERLLTWIAGRLPAPMRRLATPARLSTLVQLWRFASVGLAGLAVDTVVVYAARGTLGLVVAGLVSYVVAATATWVLNRLWTFRGLGSGSRLRQWVRFLVANLGGFVLNRGTYTLLVLLVPLFAAVPFYAVAAGAVAGLGVNFTLSRKLVFR